jgi:hypothetical protein
MSDAAASDDAAGDAPRGRRAGAAPRRGIAASVDAWLAPVDALPLETMLVVFLRLSAVVWLATGLVHWARIVGYLPWRGHLFGGMPVEWQSAIVFYGVVDLIAAVGLWLMTSWGVIVWLFAIACQILTHSALADIFGERPLRIPFYIASVVVYAFLFWRVRRAARLKAAEEGF